jgi:hypothetical protein
VRKDPEEDLLRKVEGFVAVTEQMQGQAEDHPLVRGDQIGARGLISGRTALDECGFTAVYIRPAKGACVLHQFSSGRNRLHGV